MGAGGVSPDWRIRADGRDITAIVRDRLLSLRIEDSVGAQADNCEFTLDDRDRVIEPPPTGAVLDVELGWQGQGLASMGRWTVYAREVSGPPRTLTLRAAAPDLLGGLKAPRTRSWAHVTLEDLVGALAAANGLRPQVHRTLQGLVLPHMDQVDESDLAILRRLAQQLDAVARPAGGFLVVTPRHALGQGLSPVTTIRRTDTTEYRLSEQDRDAYGAVKAQWKSAPAATPMSVRVGGGEPTYSMPGIYPDEASARNAATARLRALERGTSTANITLATGIPTLSAELPVTLADFGPPLDGQWVIVRGEHVLADDGYTTQTTLERPTNPWGRTSSTA